MHVVPNAGFQLGQVSMIEEESVGEAYEEENGEEVYVNPDETAATTDGDHNSPNDNIAQEVAEMHISDESHTRSLHEMDHLLLVCLLRALKYLISSEELPLLVSSLWNTLTR